MQALIHELKLKDVPVLHISPADAPEWNSGYIDFVTPEMMGDNVFMQGTDWHGRNFLCIQYVCVKEDRRYSIVGTIFERYRDCDKVLCFGGSLLLSLCNLIQDLPDLIIKLKKLQLGHFVQTNTTSLARCICIPSYQQVIIKALSQVFHPHMIPIIKGSIWGDNAQYV